MSEQWQKFQSQRKVSVGESWIAERVVGIFSDANEIGCACWRNEAEIEPDVDFFWVNHDDCIGIDLNL